MASAEYKFYIDWDDGDFDAPGLVDITDDVLACSTESGFNGPPPEYANAGTMRLTLKNPTGKYCNYNSLSSLYGKLKPGIRCKVTMLVGSGVEEDFWTGDLQSIVPNVGETLAQSTAELSAYGILARFQEREVSVPIQEDVTTGEALGILLDGISYTEERDIEGGQSTLSKWFVQHGNSLIQCMRDLQDAEVTGRVFEGKSGEFIFHDRAHVLASSSKGTFGTGVKRMWNLRQEDDQAYLFNIAKSKVRVFNHSDDVILATVADIYNGIGGAPPKIGVGETLILTLELDPNNNNSFISVYEWSMVDIEANSEISGGGYDITSDLAIAPLQDLGQKVKVTITNNSSVDAYLVVARGHGVAVVEGDGIPIQSPKTDPASPKEYPNPDQWITDLVDGQAELDYLVNLCKNPRARLTFDIIGNYDETHLLLVQDLYVNDRIHITALANKYGLGINADFIIDHVSNIIQTDVPGGYHVMTVSCTIIPGTGLAASSTPYNPNIIAYKMRSVGNLALTELFVQDDTNPEIYHRKIKATFVVPSTIYYKGFSKRTKISAVVHTYGGSIPRSQTLYVEVAPICSTVEGFPSQYIQIEIPDTNDSNSIDLTITLPPEADAYVVRIGDFPGKLYKHAATSGSHSGTTPFVVTISTVAVLDETSLSIDPYFDHVRLLYSFGPGEIRDGGRTELPADVSFIFEPETPQTLDTEITVFALSSNKFETDLFPFDDAPFAILVLTKDDGNPSGASELVILTSLDDSTIPEGQVVFEFKRDTVNYKNIIGICIQLSVALPAEGPFEIERNSLTILEMGTCTVAAGEKIVTGITRGPDPTVVGEVLLIYTDDSLPDTDLEGTLVESEGEDVLVVTSPFNKSGNFTYVIIKRFWDIPADSSNAAYYWFNASEFSNRDQLTWRTPPRSHPSGSLYGSGFSRNTFGLGTRIVTATPYDFGGPTELVVALTLDAHPDDLVITTSPISGYGRGDLVYVTQNDGSEMLSVVEGIA